MTDWTSLAGRTLMIGLPGPSLDDATRQAVRDLAPGGVILFRRNLEEPGALSALMAELRELLPSPALFAIDQEGGRVSRLSGWIGNTPTAIDLARAGTEATFRFSLATAAALRALGFNLDFAPVVDLSEPDASNGIADRSFGTDPENVVRLAGAFLDGLQRGGVAGCLKHFPGLGDTSVDSHVSMPVCPRDLARLEAEDLAPFRRLGPKAASIMVGHSRVPALDPEGELPATLSSAVVNGWLRGRLGYRGLVVSDDLEMGAVTALDAAGRLATAALGAGCDLLLYCSDLERAHRARGAIVSAAAEDPVFARRLEGAARAVVAAAARWPAPEPTPGSWEVARTALGEASRLA